MQGAEVRFGKIHRKSVASVPLRGAGSLDRASSRGGGEKWSDTGYLLKVESSRFGDRLEEGMREGGSQG